MNVVAGDPPDTRRRLATAVDEVVPVLRDNAAETDRTGDFPLAGLRALAENGLMGLMVPAEHGGLGGDLGDVARIAQHLAGACVSTAFVWVMHCQQVDAVARFAQPALRDRLLPRLARDGGYLASVTAEAGTGGRLLQGEEALVRTDGGFRLVRNAPVVSGGSHAGGYLVKMRSAPDSAGNDVSLIYVDRAQAEVDMISPGWDALGMRGVQNVSLRLRGEVPADQIVGGLNGFRRVVLEGFGVAAHVGWSACWLGAARSCFSQLLRETRAGRLRSIDPAADLSRQRLALIRSRLESVSAYLRCVVDEVAARRVAGQTLELPAVQVHVNTLKVLAARETRLAVDEMIDLAGLRVGYLRAGPIPLERVFRDLRAASLTYDDTALLLASGAQTMLDPAVTTVGEW